MLQNEWYFETQKNEALENSNQVSFILFFCITEYQKRRMNLWLLAQLSILIYSQLFVSNFSTNFLISNSKTQHTFQELQELNHKSDNAKFILVPFAKLKTLKISKFYSIDSQLLPIVPFPIINIPLTLISFCEKLQLVVLFSQ